MEETDLTCGECLKFRPINMKSSRGICIPKSKFKPGGFLPPGAKVIDDPKGLAKPFIVRKDSIVKQCTDRKTV